MNILEYKRETPAPPPKVTGVLVEFTPDEWRDLQKLARLPETFKQQIYVKAMTATLTTIFARLNDAPAAY